MKENKNISDLPSYSKVREEINAAHTVGKIIKGLSFFGIKNEKLSEAFAKIPDLKKEADHLSTLPDRFNQHFSKIGWIAHESMNSPLMEKSVELAENGLTNRAENLLADHFTSIEMNWLQHRFKVRSEFRIRYDLIKKAYNDTLNRSFYTSVPLLLTIIDGVVNDISKSKGFFSENTELSAWDSVAAHHSGLATVRDIFNAPRKKTNSEEIFLPYRNGILHGRDLNFNNKFVAAKCWSTLFAINDWAKALDDKIPNSLENYKPKTLKEGFSELKKVIREHQEWKAESAKEWKKLEDWKPRENIDNDPLKFTEFSPERMAFETVKSWQNRNYGNIARSIHRFSSKEVNINVEAGNIRKDLQNKILHSFQIKSIKDEAPAISEITMDIVYELNSQKRSKEIVMRMICKSKDGSIALNGNQDIYWELIDDFFYRLDF